MAIIIILVLVGVGAAALYMNGPLGTASTSTFSSGGQTTASQSSSGSPSGTSSSTGLNITNMFANVIGAGLQAPARNSTSIFDRSTYTAAAGATFTVDVEVVYSGCGGRCPTQFIAVVAGPSGFTVEETTPSMPVPVEPTTGVEMAAHFTITLQGPSSPYTGPLTLFIQAG
jgi:hypothetical protein